jgi:hypothetical protein
LEWQQVVEAKKPVVYLHLPVLPMEQQRFDSPLTLVALVVAIDYIR